MKKLNRRSKILLGIGALVLVAVVAGIVLLEPGGVSLFGGTVIHISPENPTITVGQTIDMSINSVFGCNWESSDYFVAPFVFDGGKGTADYMGDDEYKPKHVQVKGTKPGQAVIKAECMLTRKTTVTVR
jgi:hypothetical protein